MVARRPDLHAASRSERTATIPAWAPTDAAHINFNSKWGVPLAPVEYTFRTRAASESPPRQIDLPRGPAGLLESDVLRHERRVQQVDNLPAGQSKTWGRRRCRC